MYRDRKKNSDCLELEGGGEGKGNDYEWLPSFFLE